MARKVTYGAACSLDLYIARPDFSYDWIMHTSEANEVMADYWKTIDTIVMGRKTWEVAVRAGHSGGHPGIRTWVFSRSLPPSETPRVSVVSEDVVPFVRRMKDSPGKDICMMGGGELARPLLEAGLIDEVGLNIHPILLGSGVPMFRVLPRQIDLERLECRPFKNGCVYVRYAVRPKGSPAMKRPTRPNAKRRAAKK